LRPGGNDFRYWKGEGKKEIYNQRKKETRRKKARRSSRRQLGLEGTNHTLAKIMQWTGGCLELSSKKKREGREGGYRGEKRLTHNRKAEGSSLGQTGSIIVPEAREGIRSLREGPDCSKVGIFKRDTSNI